LPLAQPAVAATAPITKTGIAFIMPAFFALKIAVCRVERDSEADARDLLHLVRKFCANKLIGAQ